MKDSMIIRSRSPLRLGLAGGGTDVPPYCDEHGGIVLSASISKYAYATWNFVKGTPLEVNSRDLNVTEEIRDIVNYEGKTGLIKATMNVLGVKPGEHGGQIILHSDAPVGSGLGTSSSVNVGLIGVLWEGLGLTAEKPLHRRSTWHEIARLAHLAERKELGIAGGYQDQYISAYGGFCIIKKRSGKEEIEVIPLKMHDDAIAELEGSILLCDVKQHRHGGSIIQAQVDAFKSGQNIEILGKMKELVDPITNAMLKGDAKEFGQLLHQSWMLKKDIAAGTSNSYIDSLYEKALKTGAVYGGKITGAGGGGHMALVTDPVRKEEVKKALEGWVEFKEFSFEKKGLHVWRP